MRRRNFLRLGSGEAIGGALAACGGDTATMVEKPAPRPASQAGIVRGWNALALHAIHETQPGRLRSAHALALLHTCMYNAWAAYDGDARQTMHGRAVRLPRAERSAASRAAAISHAAHRVLCDRFPAHQADFDARLADLGLTPSRPDGQFTPEGIGRVQASAMLDFCRCGGAAPGEPLAILAFAPVWPNPFLPDTPAPHASADRSAAPDAGPVDDWCRLAQQASEHDGYDDDRDVLLYFALANALADTAIAAADAGADHPSGQAAARAAAAVVLRSFTGSAEWRIEAGDVAGLEVGKQVGALVFEKARRYWQGKL